jgi:predicted ATP-dependent serine protease
MSYKLTETKKTYFCGHCGKNYGNCIHTSNYNSLPQEESGRIISPTEFEILIEAGDI